MSANLLEESDRLSALAKLASARYAPESSSLTGTVPALTDSLMVLTTVAETRAAVNAAARSAQRLISIYTPDLEPDLYEQLAFLEIIKHFVLSHRFSKVRVLLVDPIRVMRESNRFVAMGRRLSSYIDIRYAISRNAQAIAVRTQQQASAYFIADDRAIIYRLRTDTWDGIADLRNPPVARLYLNDFDSMWNVSTPEHGLRDVRPRPRAIRA